MYYTLDQFKTLESLFSLSHLSIMKDSMGKNGNGIFALIFAFFYFGGIFILFIGSIYFNIYSFRSKSWVEFAIGIYLALWLGFTVLGQLLLHLWQKIISSIKNYTKTRK